MNKEQNNAIHRAAQRLECKPLPQDFEARVMARIERSQRREELQEQMLFAAGCIVTVGVLVWAALHYIPALDFGFARDFTDRIGTLFTPDLSFDWRLPSLLKDLHLADYGVLYFFAVVLCSLMLLDTLIRQRIRLKEQAKSEK
ncbi:MAG: hypothetical protein IJB63_02690 [Alistipes sp.]|nr:hypothetical protein [Alistipes sp.]